MVRTTQQLFDLTGQTALVTGGSRGLGLQMAHALGEAGACGLPRPVRSPAPSAQSADGC